MRKIILFILCIRIISFSGILYADDGGGIVGRINDANGRPINQAFVSVGNKSDFTDIEGRYRIKGLAAGRYKVQVRKGGSQSEVIVEIKDRVIEKNLSSR